MVRRIEARAAAPVCLAAAVLMLGGCALTVPVDAQHTLEQARGRTLQVGISANPPWTEIDPGGAVSGSEVELIGDYAESIDAQIEWSPGTESVLAEQMKQDELDIVIAGLTSDAPWTGQMALTRPYAEAADPHGGTQQKVMAVRPGENALLVSLEEHLAREGGEL